MGVWLDPVELGCYWDRLLAMPHAVAIVAECHARSSERLDRWLPIDLLRQRFCVLLISDPIFSGHKTARDVEVVALCSLRQAVFVARLLNEPVRLEFLNNPSLGFRNRCSQLILPYIGQPWKLQAKGPLNPFVVVHHGCATHWASHRPSPVDVAVNVANVHVHSIIR